MSIAADKTIKNNLDAQRLTRPLRMPACVALNFRASTYITVPQIVSGFTGVKKMLKSGDFGSETLHALRYDGTLWGWGVLLSAVLLT